jgi:REP element-mobilizing transposase RayT
MHQTELALPNTHGGRRRGAGRKRSGRSSVSHRSRPFHAKSHPVHVTMRCRSDAPSLRGSFKVVRDALARSSKKDFSIIHFSVMSNHMHLYVEALNTKALAKGMRGLNIRIARAINKLHHRRGPVWADRYHAHDLAHPTDNRNALAYILLNHQHHDSTARGIDPCSSGLWHRDWGPPPTIPSPVVPPRTFLAREGWRRTPKGRFLPDPYQYR